MKFNQLTKKIRNSKHCLWFKKVLSIYRERVDIDCRKFRPIELPLYQTQCICACVSAQLAPTSPPSPTALPGIWDKLKVVRWWLPVPVKSEHKHPGAPKVARSTSASASLLRIYSWLSQNWPARSSLFTFAWIEGFPWKNQTFRDFRRNGSNCIQWKKDLHAVKKSKSSFNVPKLLFFF